MNNIVRAWKDETYCQSLSVEEQAALPANPAGEVELTDTALEGVQGACYGRGQGLADSRDDGSTNSINQDVDQTAAATFGNNSLVFFSEVDCTATNHADLSAHIRNRNIEF